RPAPVTDAPMRGIATATSLSSSPATNTRGWPGSTTRLQASTSMTRVFIPLARADSTSRRVEQSVFLRDSTTRSGRRFLGRPLRCIPGSVSGLRGRVRLGRIDERPRDAAHRALRVPPTVRGPMEARIPPETVRQHGLSEDEYQRIAGHLGRPPNLVELGIFPGLWSEHCSYKSSRRFLK